MRWRKGLPEMAVAGPGEVVELSLGPAAERRAQDAGERQVVLGQGEERQQRDEVAHRQLGGELQPVGARHVEARRPCRRG